MEGGEKLGEEEVLLDSHFTLSLRENHSRSFFVFYLNGGGVRFWHGTT